MRKLRLDDTSLRRVLDDLDAHDSSVDPVDRTAREFFPYRINNLRIEIDLSNDETVSEIVPSRKLGPTGVYFLVGNLVHNNCACRVHLVTIRNSWQTIDGKVESCRYLPGTAGLHEIFVRFDRLIDPASFASAATQSRILVADDSPVSLKLYAHLFDTMNVQLQSVGNGLDAVERALCDTFDLVLMDLEMPEVDGLTAVQMLRSKGFVRPIVAVSAMTDPKTQRRCLEAGCDDFLAKPLTRETLAEVVNRNRAEPLVSDMLEDPGMTELIDQFVDSLPETVGRLEMAFGNENLEELAREARVLKGEAAGIGFGPITEAASTVEQTINASEERATIRRRLIELIRYCISARPATVRGEASCTPLAD